jgi:phenylalanyl-tRNA synthetase beta chain
MQFPESWLREFCNPPLSTNELANVLTMGGLEVEETRPVAPPFQGVVVGLIVEATPHPNADRLRVCRVDVGEDRLLQIVCGAPNARAGIRVPCARVGAALPPGADGAPFEIRQAKLRGVESEGMLCSARELGLSDDHGGLLELSPEAPVGVDIRDFLQLDDTIFVLKLTPNLAHCLSVYGVARELSALTGTPLKPLEFPKIEPRTDATLPVKVAAPDLCGRFSGRVIRGVNPQAVTPAWMVERLRRCGQRSVSALVDISNYVMFESGQPSHVFDLERIHGGLEVRWGRPGERLKLLNGQTVELDETVGVIADAEQVESLAGIMGGDATAVGDATRHVYLEAAFWWPRAIAGRARRFNFSTDAGHRFERGVDPALTVEHLERITDLIQKICGGEPGPVQDLPVNVPSPEEVRLRVDRAEKVLGMPLGIERCEQALRALSLPTRRLDESQLAVLPPTFRFDLRIEEDLIEEIARMIGYDQLPDETPLAPLQAKPSAESERSAADLRRVMADLGYDETISFSFVDEAWERDLAANPDPIRVLNPIASHLAVMRSTLVGSLLSALRFNLDHRVDRVRLFEIGRVFRRNPNVAESAFEVAGIDQPLKLAGIAYGQTDVPHWDGPGRWVDFFDVKGDIEQLFEPRRLSFQASEHPALHPGRSAAILLEGRSIGFVGELHPRWRQQWEFARPPVLFEIDFRAACERVVPRLIEVGRFPVSTRDIAIVLPDGVLFGAVSAAIERAAPGTILRDVRIFDVYRPKAAGAESDQAVPAGHRSLAIRLVFGSNERTLTDAEMDEAVSTILASLQREFGARLRA